MAEYTIDKIKYGSNTFKFTVPSNMIYPFLSKAYDPSIVTANNRSEGVIYFGTVDITDKSDWYKPWSIRYRLTVTTAEAETQGVYDCHFIVQGSNVAYANFNSFYDDDHRPIYNHSLLYPKNGKTSLGAHFGVRVQSSRNPTTLARFYTVELLEVTGCTVTFKNVITTYGNLFDDTKYYFDQYNATSHGLQESGDSDTGQYYLRYYNIKAQSNITAKNIIVGTTNGYVNLNSGTAFSLQYPVLYADSDISANSSGHDNYLFYYSLPITTTQAGTYTAYQPVFIKGTISGTTFTPISTTPLTQAINSVDDGYVYYYIGHAYNSSSISFDTTARLLYWYKDGQIKEYSGAAAFAVKAAKDSDNNAINTTYIKKSIGTAAGDIIYWSASGNPVRLAKGSNGQVLKLANGVPTWSTDNNSVTGVKGSSESSYRTGQVNLTSANIGALSAEATATVQQNLNTAAITYAEGDYFTYDSLLYKTLTTIAQGATLTPGTNFRTTVVTEELISLANRIYRVSYSSNGTYSYTFPTGQWFLIYASRPNTANTGLYAVHVPSSTTSYLTKIFETSNFSNYIVLSVSGQTLQVQVKSTTATLNIINFGG